MSLQGWGSSLRPVAGHPRCQAPAQESGEMLSIFSWSRGGPSLILLGAGETESGEIPLGVCISFSNFSVLNSLGKEAAQ